MISIVHSYYCRNYDQFTDVLRAHLSKDTLSVPNGKPIVIKINMCDLRTPDTGAVTHPLFLKSFVLCLRDLYPTTPVFVTEADATVVFARDFYSWLGYRSALQGLDVTFVNLGDEHCEETLIQGYQFKSLPLPTIMRDGYFITMAKLKTNVTSLITVCLKNQYVFVPGIVKSKFHRNVDRAIADCNMLRKPDFCIVDGIVGHGGPKSPSFGIPINSHCVIWGMDPVAIDTYCARLMGIPPLLIKHIRYCRRSGLGTTRYKVAGDFAEKRLDFETSVGELIFFRIAGRMQRAIQLWGRRAKP